MRIKLLKMISTILLIGILLSGCAVNSASNVVDIQSNNAVKGGTVSNKKTVTIAASFYPMYIMALNVAKDMPGVKVINMTKQTAGCLHDYALTPDDLVNLEGAQFFVVNGAGMESFMDKVTEQMPNLKIIDTSKGIPLIKGDGDEGDNPHLWVSITNSIMQVKNIQEQLSASDPYNANKYKANTDNYVKKLENERDKMHKALDGLENRNIITFHEAFPYFAKEFNLNIAGVIEREPGSEPSAGELADTIATIKELKVKGLFAEPQYPASATETIARETGAKVYTLDPAVTGPMEADAYINIMDSNLKVLQEALK
jgi:zinc transport system substrate-binding protein